MQLPSRLLTRLGALLAAILLSASVRAATPNPAWQRPAISDAERVQGYRNDVVLAQPLASHQHTVDAEEAADGTVVRQVFDAFGGIRCLAVNAGETPDQAISRLQATGRYAYVERDLLRHAFATPNDPDYPQQWHLNNTGGNSLVTGPGVIGADIHAPPAWDLRSDASPVVVAVVDTGILLSHEDLTANLWSDPSPSVANDLHGLNTVTTSATPNDDNGHGTHVSGIIAAVGNNGLETTGVAWKAQLMACKYLNSSGEGDLANELICLTYLTNHGAKVVNASYGSNGFSASEYNAIQSLQSAGIIMVCAAGNTSEDNDLSPSYPAGYLLDNIVAVAASDNRDDFAIFTCYGSGNVDLAAPGYNILSLYYTANNATAVLSGTSMATPMVTGAIALLRSQFPSDTYRQTINRLLRHVDVGGEYVGRIQTGGRLDLSAALGSAAGDNAPMNDAFASRAHLAGTAVTVRASNVGATRESGEPTIAGNSGGASLWWDWTAPLTGSVTLSTDVTVAGTPANTDFATLIGVYTGTSLASLSSVASGSGSSVSFTAQAGQTYEISIDGVNGFSGPVYFSLFYNNDVFANAVTLSGQSVGFTSTTYYATYEPGEPSIQGHSLRHPQWYSWTAPTTGHYVAAVTSPDFNPLLGVYTGSNSTLAGLTAVGTSAGLSINPNAYSQVSDATVGFNATAGTTYQIVVDGKTDVGSTDLTAGQFTFSLSDARWTAAATDAFTTSPSVGADGSVYIGGDDDVIRAYNPDGSGKWTYTAAGGFDTSAIAIGSDGTLYAGCEDGNLYALTSSGVLKWKFAVTNPVSNKGTNYIASSPALASDGTIYIKDSTSTLYAVNPDGTQKWTATVPGAGYGAPTVGSDGSVYICSDDGQGSGKVYAFTSSGSPRWTFNVAAPSYTAPAIDGAGHLYVATLAGTVFAIDANGNQLWGYNAGNSISSAPTLGSDGTVYFGCYDHKLYALNGSTGALRWTYPLGGEVRASAPLIGASPSGGDVVFVGCYDGNLYAINAAGTLNRTYATGDFIRSGPVLSGTTLYFGSTDCRLYAYDTAVSTGASAWPMYQNNPLRTGAGGGTTFAIVGQPAGVGLIGEGSLTLSVVATGQGPLAYQWQLNGVNIAGATYSTYFVPNATSASFGTYDVVVTGPQGTLTSAPAVVGLLSAPSISVQPASQTVNAGSTVTLSAAVAGGNLNYQWYFAGQPIAGATSASLILSNIAAYQGAGYGSYYLTATNSLGSASTASATVTVVTNARLLNISARADVSSGTLNTLVAGFVIGGGPKQVVIRGVGPALASYGVSDPLSAPTLTLFNSSSAQIASNSGWSSASNAAAMPAAFSAVGAFSLPANSADCAILTTLPANLYSAQVSGVGSAGGVALAEVYDEDGATSSSRLLNISARATVGSGVNALAAGFVISGSTSETILLRGVGPTLGSSPFNLPGVLAQPVLTLYDSSQNIITSNSAWGSGSVSTSTLSSIFTSVGAFALSAGSNDAVLAVTLAPGLYTAQVAGSGTSTGLALIEVYEVR